MAARWLRCRGQLTGRGARLTVVTVVVAVVAALGLAAPAQARWDSKQAKGYGFDTCTAPSQRAMNAWHRTSPFSAVGIYIAGMNRACRQPHLSRDWVRKQRAHGWRLLPIIVGRQAACSPRGWYKGRRISAKVAGDYAKAKRQGRAAARGAVRAAHRLGLPRPHVLWYDLEAFDTRRTHCRRSALRFVSAWTKQLHRHGYRSGLYSSASTLMAFDRARRLRVGRAPDRIWFAHWNGQATAASRYLSKHGWKAQRVHQYRGPHRRRHGGVRMVVDANYFALGRHHPGRRLRCGVRLGFSDYRVLRRGDRGRQVYAARCLVDGRPKVARGKRASRAAVKRFLAPYDRRLARAVRSTQRRHPALRASGKVGQRTWVVLLSRGARPVLKYGASGSAVRRVQRSLNAAAVRRAAPVRIDGVFGKADIRATHAYQRQAGLRTTGVVNRATWRALQRGRVGRR
jgi:hypothetical protein